MKISDVKLKYCIELVNVKPATKDAFEYTGAFSVSKPLTMGVELELQILDTKNYDLTPGAPMLLQRVHESVDPNRAKQEIVESMLELNTTIHSNYDDLLKELKGLRNKVSSAAQSLGLAVCSGGSHPFQNWANRQISAETRFVHLHERYGYLAKQFSVFGLHVHLGCSNAEDAIYLTHALAYYVPELIVLSASSPFYQGVDTGYQSSRLNFLSSFPLSGHMPWHIQTWDDFVSYFSQFQSVGIVSSVKDFYWDIRPSPGYGTVELRIMDSPITVTRAAQLAAFAQILAHYLLEMRPFDFSPSYYLFYMHNRFEACRFGYLATQVDLITGSVELLHRKLVSLLKTLISYVNTSNVQFSVKPLLELLKDAEEMNNDASWLKYQYAVCKELPAVVRAQAAKWRVGA